MWQNVGISRGGATHILSQVNAPIRQSANATAQGKSVKCSERGAFIICINVCLQTLRGTAEYVKLKLYKAFCG